MDINERVKCAEKFPWGKPLEWFEIGPYTILKFNPRIVENGCASTKSHISKEVSYHGWIDGKDSNESWPTPETCIAGLIGRKWAGDNNGGVGYYFCRMVEAPPYNK